MLTPEFSTDLKCFHTPMKLNQRLHPQSFPLLGWSFRAVGEMLELPIDATRPRSALREAKPTG